MFLIGDSHTRSYGDSKFLSSVFFLTSGKRINLSRSLSFVRLLFYCFVSGRRARKNEVAYAIIIGEPDLRHLHYGAWMVNEGVTINYASNDLKRLGSRLEMLLTILEFFELCPALIIGIGTPNAELKDSASELNYIFEKVSKSKNIKFFNPMQVINSLPVSEFSKYVGFSVFDKDKIDNVHISARIAKDLDYFLEANGFNKEKRKNPKLYFKSAKYVSEFGVYKL